MSDEKVDLGQAQLRSETSNAIKVQIEGEDKERWIPKSVIDDDSEVYGGDGMTGNLVVAHWWADKEGLV